ncbi:MAG: hypothetical protein K8H84_09435 [Sulfuricella denitrificans]|nr:hypothetical protein [Sulfuricella denitrificans]
MTSIEFSSDRAERLVVGLLLALVGGAALLFWNVERGVQWQHLAIFLSGMFFAGFGLFLIGFRRRIRLDPKGGVIELSTLFGSIVSRRHYPLKDFESIGCHGSIQEGPWWDLVLFRDDGDFLTLRRMLGDKETQREIERLSRLLGLRAEYEPRIRTYLFK